MQLREWQEAVQRSILAPGQEAGGELLAWIKTAGLPAGCAGARDRLDVYADAYRLRLTEALRTNYPALHKLLGDDDFSGLAHRYLKAHPPRHASIRWFGDSLADFMRAHPPYREVPAMADLAAFEWALRHTADAADGRIVSARELQETSPGNWGELAFGLHPSLTILELRWNAPQLWRALDADENPPRAVHEDTSWLVYRRPDLASGWRSATAPEVAALRCIDRGLTVADLCEALCDSLSDPGAVPLAVATFLRDWVGQGLLVVRD
jgi:hypothetical protein